MVSESAFKTDPLKKIACYSYIPRVFACFTGLAVMVTIFSINNSNAINSSWLLLPPLIICLAWPHLAYYWAKHSNDAKTAMIKSVLIDSFIVGFSVPIISFEIIPSTVFVTAIIINNISLGGLKLFIKGLITLISAMIMSSLLISPTIRLESNIMVILTCLPMITLYPISLATINYRLTRLLLSQKRKLLHLSRNDDLTGVFSRRYWDQRLLEEFNRCQRSGEDACVMMVDIDHFKHINDAYGHLIGDNVLKQFGRILQSLRASDITGRYGGEEFAILLPNSNFEKSLSVAERLRNEIEKTQFDTIGHCTASIGIAPLNNDYKDAYNWLDQADKALYEAKANGRNRVCTSLEANAY